MFFLLELCPPPPPPHSHPNTVPPPPIPLLPTSAQFLNSISVSKDLANKHRRRMCLPLTWRYMSILVQPSRPCTSSEKVFSWTDRLGPSKVNHSPTLRRNSTSKHTQRKGRGQLKMLQNHKCIGASQFSCHTPWVSCLLCVNWFINVVVFPIYIKFINDAFSCVLYCNQGNSIGNAWNIGGSQFRALPSSLFISQSKKRFDVSPNGEPFLVLTHYERQPY